MNQNGADQKMKLSLYTNGNYSHKHILSQQEMRKNLIEEKLLMRQQFQEANISQAKFYRLAMNEKEQAYIQGQEDAFAVIIKELLTIKSVRSLKNVPITQFLQILNQKKADLRKPKGNKAQKGSLNMAQKPQNLNITGNSREAQYQPQSQAISVNASSVPLSPPGGSDRPISEKVNSLQKNFTNIAINALATECENQQKQNINIISRIKGNIGEIRVSENKIRSKPNDFYSEESQKSCKKLQKDNQSPDSNFCQQKVKKTEKSEENEKKICLSKSPVKFILGPQFSFLQENQKKDEL